MRDLYYMSTVVMLYLCSLRVCVCVGVCVCVCVCVFIFTFIHREGFICLEQQGLPGNR